MSINTKPRLKYTLLAAMSLLGYLAGYFSADKSPGSQVGDGPSEQLQTHPDDRRMKNPEGRIHFTRNHNIEQNPLLLRLNITPSEWNETMALNKRGEAGEYILRYERPTTQKFLKHDVQQITAHAAAEQFDAKNQLFAKLGIPTDISDQLMTHAMKIHKASLEAELATQQLMKARLDYDQRVRSALDPGKYDAYRQYEASQAANREFRKVQEFAAEKEVRFDAQSESAVVAAIQELGAYTEISWHGPYDGLPLVVMGKDNVIADIEAKSQELTGRIRVLSDQEGKNGLAPQHHQLLREYYAGRLSNYERAIDLTRNPPPIDANAEPPVSGSASGN